MRTSPLGSATEKRRLEHCRSQPWPGKCQSCVIAANATAGSAARLGTQLLLPVPPSTSVSSLSELAHRAHPWETLPQAHLIHCPQLTSAHLYGHQCLLTPTSAHTRTPPVGNECAGQSHPREHPCHSRCPRSWKLSLNITTVLILPAQPCFLHPSALPPLPHAC